jgi:hypothetical protein
VVNVKASIFTIELSKLNIDEIRSFCNQGFSEGLRIEYKKDFPKNLKLAETICAFANTQGGIIFVGVEADATKNTPKNVDGIELREGLEEKIINLCLSHISPSISPEVKVCDFKSDSEKTESDRAVLFIRVRQSYSAPHYLLNNNEIRIRVHNRNSLADLRTIENLIQKREAFISESSSGYPFYDMKEIEIQSKAYETVVVTPKLQVEPIIYFYNRENSDWLFRTVTEVMRLNEQRPETWRLRFVGLNQATRQITRYCSIDRWGKIVFQRTATVDKTDYLPFATIVFIAEILKNAQKIYSHFGFFGDLSVGLTLDLMENLNILRNFSNFRLPEGYEFKGESIRISKNVAYDELSNPQKLLEEFFKEICVNFGLILPEETVVKIIAQALSKVRT